MTVLGGSASLIRWLVVLQVLAISYAIVPHTNPRVLGYWRLTWSRTKSAHVFDSMTGPAFHVRTRVALLALWPSACHVLASRSV